MLFYPNSKQETNLFYLKELAEKLQGLVQNIEEINQNIIKLVCLN